MAYTSEEMVFFNSLLDGREIFGIRIELPMQVNKEYTEKTIGSLQEKGIIDENRKLVQTKENPALLLRVYKEASEYIVINHLRIALVGRKYVVVILRKEKEYEIYGASRVAFFMQLIENTPLLREKAVSWETSEKKTEFTVQEIKQSMEKESIEDITILQKYEKGKQSRDYILLEEKERAELFDGVKKTRQVVNGQTIRVLLQEMLEIRQEET